MNTPEPISNIDEQIRVAISHAIQGVQEYTAKDISDYYENRSKWVNLSADTITRLITQEQIKELRRLWNDPKAILQTDSFTDNTEFLKIVLPQESITNRIAELEATLNKENHAER